MASIPTHSRILADAARRVLTPFGVRQRGRSRTWLDDRGWWLVVVEFQPSSWSKGAYLNVGAMWLWKRTDFLSFDFGHRVEHHREFRDASSFAVDAEYLARRAAEEVLHYRALFTDVVSVADVLRPGAANPGWPRFHAGIAAALAHRPDEAAVTFDALLREPATAAWHVELKAFSEELRASLAAPNAFRARITDIVTETRRALKLPPWSGDLPTP